MKPSFSIITHVLNSKEQIPDCLENVRERGEESKCQFEHIVLDGGSTDGTTELIREYAAQHPHVLLIPDAGSSVAGAGNEALKVARNQLIGWLAVDEGYSFEAFCVVAEKFEDDQDLKVLIGSHNKVMDDGSIIDGESSSYTNQTDLIEFWHNWGLNILLPWHSTFYKRTLHGEIGPYNDKYHCFEYEFFLRASEKCQLTCIVDRLTDFKEDGDSKTKFESLSSRSRNDFLNASKAYWGNLGKRKHWKRALTSWYYTKLRRTALLTEELLAYPNRKILKPVRRFKHRLIYTYNRRYFSKVRQTPTFTVNPDSPIEIHSLCCHRDYYMLLLCLKSFLRYYSDVRVVVHDDGTLGKQDREQLRDQIRGIEIIDIRSDPNEFDACADRDINIYKAKGIVHYGKGRKILMIDSDMLFINRPTEIIDWIKSDQKVQLYGKDRWENHNPFMEIKRTINTMRLPPFFNAGLVCLHAENIRKEDFISVFQRLGVFKSVHFVEQATFCYLISRNPYATLPADRYVPCLFSDADYGKDEITERTAHLHFMGNKKHAVNGLYRFHAEKVISELKELNNTTKKGQPTIVYEKLPPEKEVQGFAGEKETLVR